MSRASSLKRDFAKQLITFGARGRTPVPGEPVIFHIADKLHVDLATLMGAAGFRALLTRALALATPDAPWLRRLALAEDGTLTGLDNLHTQLDPEEILEGRIVLLAQILSLLEAFIGEKLTMRLVTEAWPQFSPDNVNTRKKAENEKPT